MSNPRDDLLMSLADYHTATINGNVYPCVFSESSPDDENVSTATPEIGLAGDRINSESLAAYYSHTDSEALSKGQLITEISGLGKVRTNYAIEEIAATDGPLVRIRLRKL